ncbi:MAG: hypothetical protein A3H70_02450 [Candidatus Komeilibacteria bacterium RIFCSPLOWO2_02_FULL_48_11]|uniref:PEP-utilising enzyme mobile domain-containing protein n=1 Tax=Candidatus Komeilibacteria bacterium RIFCSPLOWO2_02_FULL_48_11 TaxID=1798553 RepID=A0A1G2BVG8_9BACT|nr:MAG: hypothetical protein A3H70_02450 [Candidatus Komeilibacteria bacterium RIFCSPLOWO2_02_FULL_48_11]
MPQEKYHIIRDRKYDLTPGYWNSISQTSARTKDFYGRSLSKIWALYKDGFGLTLWPKREYEEAGEYISDNLFKDKYYQRIAQEIIKEQGKIEVFLTQPIPELSRLSFDELVKYAGDIMSYWLGYDEVNVFAWCVGGDFFSQKVQEKLRLPDDVFSLLSTPDEKTEAGKLELAELKAARDVLAKKTSIQNAANDLAEQFSCLPFGYDGPEYWDASHFTSRLLEISEGGTENINAQIIAIEEADRKRAKEKDRALKKHKISAPDKILIDRINTLAVWTDVRKKLQFPLHYRYGLILRELKQRYNVPFRNLRFLLVDELNELEGNKKAAEEKMLWRLGHGFMVEYQRERCDILSEERKQSILDELAGQTTAKEITGTVASRGPQLIYTGIAKVVRHPNEGTKVLEGDFIITSMTSPDYVAIMQRAAGFITDEGGVTCHAAIVGREMGKPVIIGTGNATKVLKDGDRVEVDTEKGVVKKI